MILQTTNQRGFTLIELLIVVAIIAILAAIAVPNFLEAQTRSKVSRVQADMRTINTALEAYAVDNNAYPPSIGRSPMEPLPRRNISGMDKRLLTTPIAYITTVPAEAFVTQNPGPGAESGRLNIYGSHRGFGTVSYNLPFNSWMMWSIGPDLRTQTGGYRPLEIIERSEDLYVGFGLEDYGPTYNGVRYDPTNGTLSIGDIYRFGPNATEAF